MSERSHNSASDAATKSGGFPRTRWTLVDVLRHGGRESERALSELCEIYWYPVYAYIRRSGVSQADAEDVTQGFFELLLRRKDLASVNPTKGKLRTYLLTALKHFHVSEYRKTIALKRGGEYRLISIDSEGGEQRLRHEPTELDTPERLFERQWALALIDEALAMVKSDYVESGRSDLFAAISPFLAGQEQRDPDYAAVAGHLGMTAGAVQVAVHRLRKRFRRCFEQAIGNTLKNPTYTDAVRAEIGHMLQVMSN